MPTHRQGAEPCILGWLHVSPLALTLAFHGFRLAVRRRLVDLVVPPPVSSHGHGAAAARALEHEYVLDRVATGHGAVHYGLQRNGLATAQQLIGRDHHNGVARVNALAKRLRGETLHKNNTDKR